MGMERRGFRSRSEEEAASAAAELKPAKETTAMEIDKNTVLDFLREQGKDQEATQADQELPDQLDTDRDAGLLERFGVDIGSLVQRFTGGTDIPGV
jgi:hypothetical protein